MGRLQLGIWQIACGSALALAPAVAPAQEQVVLPEVVVSATGIPTPVTEVANSVTVITAKEIQQQHFETVPEALRSVPGLNVVQTGGPGGQTSVFIRGTNSNQVKVLIDGIDASDPSIVNGAVDFAHLLTGDIERIEVLRGPQSGLYGSDAIGGVISITTKKGEGPPKVTGQLDGGSLGTFNQNASLSGSEGKFNYAFNVQHLRATNIPVTPLYLLAPGEKRNDDNYNNWTYSTRLGLDLSENLAVNAVARYTDAKHGFTGDDFVNFPIPSPEALQDTSVNRNLFTRGELVWSLFDGRFKNYFGVNYSNQWSWNFDPNPDSFNPFGTVAPPTTNLGVRTKVDWRGEIKVLPGQTVLLGLEDERQSLRTDSTGMVVAGAFVPTLTQASNGNKAGFVELQSEFAKRFFVVSNVRYDDNESFGPHTTWRVAPALIVPGTETKLKASYGTGFKAPTLSQLYVNDPSIGQVANPNLRPELSQGYDAGLEQPLLGGKLRVGATYFHNDLTDLIVNQCNLVGFVFSCSYSNVGRATTQGVEAFATAAVLDNLALRAEYTRTLTRDETTGLGLLRRPANKASLTGTWAPVERLSLAATVVYLSSWVDVNRDTAVFIPRVDAPAYTTVNLAANYRVDEHVTAFARIDNLFDRRYESPIGYLAPPFGVFGGVRVTN